ncbi:ORF6N domain-containing protein, partial [Escherichia coli]|nr:ORF6N domain-containing protein [Escherichia coli]
MATQISVETLSPIAYNQIPVITTELLAQLYGTETVNIKMNFSRNSARFVQGKHFFKLEGNELREFKHRLSLSESVSREVTESYSVKIARNVRSLILWTERGAARHAKMLETDQAWEVFEKLEDCYFSQGKTAPTEQQPQIQPQFTAEEIILLCYM